MKQSAGDRAFTAINYVVLSTLMLAISYPLIYVLSASVSDPMAVNAGKMWLWPVDATWEGYRRVVQNAEIWLGYRNTIFYAGVGTAYNLMMTIPCAYALSHRGMPGRGAVMGVFLFTMFFGGGLIPSYFLNRDLGLIDNPLVLILPTGASVMNIIIARSYFASTIPDELKDAASIDGCSHAYCFTKIALPLSKPIVAIIALYCVVGHWNAYFNAMIYLNNRATFPLQLFLREILVQEQMSAEMTEAVDSDFIAQQQRIAEMVKYSTMIVSALPLLVAYPFMQGFFVKGVMIGSLKG